MNFGFTDEQELLRAEVRKFLDQSCPMDAVRELMETERGYSPDTWKQLAELGWLGLTIPEAHGGAGLGFVDLVVLLEETGRSLFPSPLLTTTLAARVLAEAGSPEQQARFLPGLADGTRIGTLALLEASDRLSPEGIGLEGAPDADGFRLSGEKLYVPDAGNANLFLVAFRTGSAPDAISLAVVEADASGVEMRRLPFWYDVDDLGGLTRLGRDLARPGADARAPRTARVLARLDLPGGPVV